MAARQVSGVFVQRRHPGADPAREFVQFGLGDLELCGLVDGGELLLVERDAGR